MVLQSFISSTCLLAVGLISPGAHEPIRGTPSGVAMNSAGEVYVTGWGGTAKYTADMEVAWNEETVDGTAVEVDAAGDAWVLNAPRFPMDPENLSLTRLSASKEVLWTVRPADFPQPVLSKQWVLNAAQGKAYFAVQSDSESGSLVEIISVDGEGDAVNEASYTTPVPAIIGSARLHGQTAWILLYGGSAEGGSTHIALPFNCETGEFGVPAISEVPFGVYASTVDPFGNVYLLGTSLGDGGDWMHISKHGAEGELLWEELIDARVRERKWEPVDIEADALGNCYVIANGPYFETRIYEYIHGYRVWKFDRHGNRAWQGGYIGYHPLLADWAEDLVVSPEGIAAVATRSLVNTYGAPIYEGGAATYGPDGNAANYGRPLGNEPWDNVTALRMAADGTLLVTGEDFDSGNPYYATTKRKIEPVTELEITYGPVSRTIPIGGSASLSVVATWPEPLTYQWRRNNVVIEGATSQVLHIENFEEAKAGYYQVVVSNGTSSEYSGSAYITVGPALVGSFDGVSLVSSGRLRLDVSNLVPNARYQLESSGDLRNWSRMERLTTSTGAMRIFVDADSTAGEYFRLWEEIP